MKKYLLLFALLCTICFAYAAPVKNMPITIGLPDGTKLLCFVTGDEFYRYVHDDKGYAIVEGGDKFYYYALPSGDKNLLVSPYKVGEVDPETIPELSQGSLISEEYYMKLRSESTYLQGRLSSSAPASGVSRALGAVNIAKTGNMTGLVIFVKLADDNEFTKGYDELETLFNGRETASVSGFFEANSYRNLTMSYHFPQQILSDNGIIVSYHDLMDRNYLNTGNNPPVPESNWGDSNLHREHALYRRAIEWINENCPLPDDVDVDLDNDGVVDNVCFIIEGNAASWGDTLWPHAWSLYSTNAYINTGKGSKRIGSYFQTFSNWMDINVICHETYHTFGTPDFYRYDNIYPNGGTINRWDPMVDNNNVLSLCYNRWRYQDQKWVTEIPEITQSGTYTLNSSLHPTNNCFKIKSPYDDYTYFYVEYRQKSGLYEGNVPGNGLIVYRVDTRYDGAQNGPYKDEVYLYRPGGDMGNEGNFNNAYFSKEAGRTKINDATNPSSFLQNGNFGGLDISEISSATSESSQITFKVNIRSMSDSLTSVITSGSTVHLINGNTKEAMYYDETQETFFAQKDANTTGMPNEFKVRYLSDNYTFRIIFGTGCLEIPEDATDNTPVRIGEYQGLDNQLWHCIYGNDGKEFYIRNVANPDLYLSAKVALEAPIVVRTSTTGGRPLWSMKIAARSGMPAPLPEIRNGAYYKILQRQTGKAIQPVDASPYAGVVIQQVEPNDSDAQLWQLTLNNEGNAYILKNKNSKKVLDVRSFTMNGVQIFQSDDVSRYDYGQHWLLTKVSTGVYGIVNRLSAKALDNSNKTIDKAPLIQYTNEAQTNRNQQWQLIEMPAEELVKNGSFTSNLTNWTVTSEPTGITGEVTSASNPIDGNYASFSYNQPYSINIGQRITGVEEGMYELKAFVRSNGGFVMFGQDVSGQQPEISSAIPTTTPSDDFVEISIVIPVKSTSVQIGFKGDGLTEGSWLHIDNVSLKYYSPWTSNEIIETDINKPVVYNTPNPFEGETSITYILTETAKKVKLLVYNTSGSVVDQLEGLPVEQGENQMIYRSSKLLAGIYYYVLLVEDTSGTRTLASKMIVK